MRLFDFSALRQLYSFIPRRIDPLQSRKLLGVYVRLMHLVDCDRYL
jgi:hypothetical protein